MDAWIDGESCGREKYVDLQRSVGIKHVNGGMWLGWDGGQAGSPLPCVFWSL